MSEPEAGYQPWSRPGFVGRQENFYCVMSDGMVRVEAHLTLLRGPEDPSLISVRLPLVGVPLESVQLGEPDTPAQDFVTLPFTQTGDATYNIELPLEKLSAGQTTLICQWLVPLDGFRFEREKYWVDLNTLIPVVSYKVHVNVDPDSGFELTLAATDSWATPFTANGTEKPVEKYGRCALPIQRRQ